MRAPLCCALILSAGTILVTAPGSVALAQDTRDDVPRQFVNASTDPLLRTFRWRSIGPAGQGGRVDDIAVLERDPSTFYVGYATGGVWKTINGGITLEPIFETYGSASIGAVAVSQTDPSIVWVGTGEGNGRNSSSFGDGVYKSTDAGRTFTHMGLRETQTIQRVLIDPRDADVVYVAGAGHLYGPNPERGLFKTTDGGATWENILFVDDDTGVIEVVFDPSAPDVLYAATYQRRRTPWGFNGGGPGSGIWKTVNAGETWTELTGNGLPAGPKGRIGLAVSPSNPNVVYAQIEVMRDEARIADAGNATRSSRPEAGADNAGGVWRSDDKGATWQFQSDHNVRPQYYSELKVDPNDENVVYSTGRRFYRSEDGGKTFQVIPGPGHADHHAIWINPNNSNHLLIGNDGGFDATFDRGRTWEAFRTVPVGQFAGMSVDMQRPYYVYGGLQDNGSWAGPSQTRSDYISAHDWFSIGGGDGAWTASDPDGKRYIYSTGQRGRLQRLDVTDGTITVLQPRPPRPGAAASNVVPPPSADEQFRWNWSAPFIMSKEGPNVLLLGANRLFKSVDHGNTWMVGPDLTRQVDTDTLSIMGVDYSQPYCHGSTVRIAVGQDCILSRADGTWFYSSIHSISESPLPSGPIWVGTDDGNVQVSRDGITWTNVSGNMRGAPQDCYVARAEASNFDAATAYVALNCKRNDDLRPHLYVTRDLGRTWSSISGDLPAHQSINVVRQDSKNPDLLFVGTEFGFFVTLDEGASWQRFMTGLSTVRVDEVIVHPRDGDLVLGTHGRSVLIMDDITPLQQLTPVVRASDVHVFTPRDAILWKRDARLARSLPSAKHFQGENPAPGTAIHYYLKQAASTPVTIRIEDPRTGTVIRELNGPAQAGINRVQWDLLEGEARSGANDSAAEAVAPGTYVVRLTAGGREYTRLVVVREDIWMDGGT